MDSSFVIKVKYGDTLRRFNAHVDENNQLDLDMVRLRAKILSLFNFPVDANFILRYVDEDGDLVTLVDDDDLHDLMRQRLKFLRIDVHMSYDSGDKSNASSGSSTSLRSPPVPNQLLSGKVLLAADALKSVPEALRGSVLNLVLDLFSKADTITKMGQSIRYSDSQHQVAASPVSKNGVPGETVTPKGRGPHSTCVESNSNASQPVEAGNVTRGVVAGGNIADRLGGNVLTAADALKSVPEPLRETLTNFVLDFLYKAASSSPVIATLGDPTSKMGQSILNSDCQPQVTASPISKNGVPEETVAHRGRGPQSTCVESNSDASQQAEAGNVTRGLIAGVSPVDLNISPCDPSPSQSTNVNTAPLSSTVPDGDGDGKKGKVVADDSFTGKGDSSGTFTSAAPDYISSQSTAMGYSPFVECPFSGTYDLEAPSFGNHRMHPFKRSHCHTVATGGVFHKGIRCDGCGVYPITGPRFKSKVKVDYDLCSICLNKMGNETDYIRMDQPVSVRGPQSFKGQPWMVSPKLPHPFRSGANLKHAKPKLDSRFVLDVNVIDGTMMAPSTAFTKIWRMQNNGTLVWRKGTQLVWIGGNKFSESQSVDLEVPEDGVPVGMELDIAVDFRAPQLPGRYISYWRMAHPSGKKFGQRVWVLIQVDASLKDLSYDRSQGLNLNIPLDATVSEGPQIIDINVQPIVDDVFLQPHNSSAPTEPVRQMVDEQPRQELENNLPINESTFVGHNASPPATFLAPSSVSYPIIDLSETAPAVPLPSNQQSAAEMVDEQPRQGLENDFPINEYTFVDHNAVPPATSVAPSSVSYPIIDLSETAPAVPSNQQSSADMVDEQPRRELENDLPIYESTFVGHNASPALTSVAPSSISYPIIDLSETAPVVPSNQQSSAVDALSSSLGIGGNNSVEEALLKELEEMGFKEVDLNKEILRMNEYNLEQSLEDLCVVSDWDPILEELQEMGFHDNEMNKKLLLKNNGSIKRVVMDLINGEKV